MTTTQRSFGRPPSMKDLLARGKEFTDAAMELEIDTVLRQAGRMRAIGWTAAKLSGVKLQREGDADSKRLVFAAYDNIYDLMAPSFRDIGPDATKELFDTELTRDTLVEASRNLDSSAFSRMAYRYRKNDEYFEMTDDGLVLQPDLTLPKKFEARRGGCPYAQTEAAAYFNRFTDRIVDTFTEASRRDMPDGWLNAVGNLLSRRP